MQIKMHDKIELYYSVSNLKIAEFLLLENTTSYAEVCLLDILDFNNFKFYLRSNLVDYLHRTVDIL